MPSLYQEFAKKARERFLAKQQKKLQGSGSGQYIFTAHSRYKMQQYGLSEQRVKGIIRNPKRKEEGIVPKTAAVMQPVSMKMVDGKETWKQEIWVMYVLTGKHRSRGEETVAPRALPQPPQIKIISAWRYPGVSPKRHPIPDEILREIEEGNILEAEADNYL